MSHYAWHDYSKDIFHFPQCQHIIRPRANLRLVDLSALRYSPSYLFLLITFFSSLSCIYYLFHSHFISFLYPFLYLVALCAIAQACETDPRRMRLTPRIAYTLTQARAILFCFFFLFVIVVVVLGQGPALSNTGLVGEDIHQCRCKCAYVVPDKETSDG